MKGSSYDPEFKKTTAATSDDHLDSPPPCARYPIHCHHTPADTGQSLATFRGRWAGDDLNERLAEVYQLRG